MVILLRTLSAVAVYVLCSMCLCLHILQKGAYTVQSKDKELIGPGRDIPRKEVCSVCVCALVPFVHWMVRALRANIATVAVSVCAQGEVKKNGKKKYLVVGNKFITYYPSHSVSAECQECGVWGVGGEGRDWRSLWGVGGKGGLEVFVV